MARSIGKTFSDKLTFPDEPSDEPISTSTIKREEKENPRHRDDGQEV
jgi:hypothetical protein